jgi:hypothetical protein
MKLCFACIGNRELHTPVKTFLAIVSFGNGLTLSLEAAPQIRNKLLDQGGFFLCAPHIMQQR